MSRKPERVGNFLAVPATPIVNGRVGDLPKKMKQKTPKPKLNDFDIYQTACKKTAVYPKIGKKFVYPVFGLLGEAGEVSEKIKKLFRDHNGKLTKEYKLEIGKELGDVMWYISQLSTELGLKLSDITRMNIEKLSSRKDRNKIHGSGDDR